MYFRQCKIKLTVRFTAHLLALIVILEGSSKDILYDMIFIFFKVFMCSFISKDHSCSAKRNQTTSAMDHVTVTFLCYVHLPCARMESYCAPLISLQYLSLYGNTKYVPFKGWSLNYNHKLEMRLKKKKVTKENVTLKEQLSYLVPSVKTQECGCITARFSNPQSRGELSQEANEKSGRPAWIQKLKTKMCTVVYLY